MLLPLSLCVCLSQSLSLPPFPSSIFDDIVCVTDRGVDTNRHRQRGRHRQTDRQTQSQVQDSKARKGACAHDVTCHALEGYRNNLTEPMPVAHAHARTRAHTHRHRHTDTQTRCPSVLAWKRVWAGVFPSQRDATVAAACRFFYECFHRCVFAIGRVCMCVSTKESMHVRVYQRRFASRRGAA